MKVIVLAGGSGTRLWPLSRTNCPKQFLRLKNMPRSIFQMTVARACRLTGLQEIYLVTNACYKFLVRSQIEELGLKASEVNILIEPEGRNTLPAILYGVREIRKHGEDLAVVFPSDHLVGDELKFLRVVQKGAALAGEYLVTYGIKPDKPHTGYGYIKPGEPVGEGYQVAEFKEKPDEKAALRYLEKGYLWNSGMFLFHTGVFAEEVERHCPEVSRAFTAEDISEVYKKTPAVSIDYGLMEKSRRVAVVPLEVKWSDLGSFDAFFGDFLPQRALDRGAGDREGDGGGSRKLRAQRGEHLCAEREEAPAGKPR